MLFASWSGHPQKRNRWALCESYLICVNGGEWVLSQSVVYGSLKPHGLLPARFLCPWGFSRQEHWSGLPFPFPGDLPDPGIQPRSPAVKADCLPAALSGKCKWESGLNHQKSQPLDSKVWASSQTQSSRDGGRPEAGPAALMGSHTQVSSKSSPEGPVAS